MGTQIACSKTTPAAITTTEKCRLEGLISSYTTYGPDRDKRAALLALKGVLHALHHFGKGGSDGSDLRRARVTFRFGAWSTNALHQSLKNAFERLRETDAHLLNDLLMAGDLTIACAIYEIIERRVLSEDAGVYVVSGDDPTVPVDGDENVLIKCVFDLYGEERP